MIKGEVEGRSRERERDDQGRGRGKVKERGRGKVKERGRGKVKERGRGKVKGGVERRSREGSRDEQWRGRGKTNQERAVKKGQWQGPGKPSELPQRDDHPRLIYRHAISLLPHILPVLPERQLVRSLEFSNSIKFGLPGFSVTTGRERSWKGQGEVEERP